MDRRQSSSSGMMEGPFRFLPAEVKEMEERLFPVTNRRLDHILMDELALKFSCFRRRAGMVPVKPKQVCASTMFRSTYQFQIPSPMNLRFHSDLDMHASRCSTGFITTVTRLLPR
jgi:hypothetical protein